MGFISSLSRRMRVSYTFSSLSTTHVHQDEDSKDLIKSTPNTASPIHEPDESTESTSPTSTTSSTIVHNSPTEVIQPSDSPQEVKPFGPADLNLHTLFENGQTLDPAKDLIVSPLTVQEYPVLKLDTTISPSDTPAKQLDAPVRLDPESKMIGRSKSMKGKFTESWDGDEREDTPSPKETRSKLRRSMTGFLKRGYSLKISRTPTVSRTLKNKSSLSWLDSSSLMGDKWLVNDKETKWLEAHGIKGGRDIGHWSGDGMGRAW